MIDDSQDAVARPTIHKVIMGSGEKQFRSKGEPKK